MEIPEKGYKSSTRSSLFAGDGTSHNPCNDAYLGSQAFSEPETDAIANFLTSLKDRLLMYMDIHSYSQIWLTNYGHTADTRPTDAAEGVCQTNWKGAAISMKINLNTPQWWHVTFKTTNTCRHWGVLIDILFQSRWWVVASLLCSLTHIG